jgi:hypothetical protein
MEPARKESSGREQRGGPPPRKLRFDRAHPRSPKHVHFQSGKGRRGGR